MNSRLKKIYEKFKKQGLTADQEQKIRCELICGENHELESPEECSDNVSSDRLPPAPATLYAYSDLAALQSMNAIHYSYTNRIGSLDELLERDKQREEDGFPRKIRVGRLVKPSKGGREKVVVVPTTVEEKFIHDTSVQEEQEEATAGGSGDGEEGEVIGEQPVRTAQGGGAGGPGEGEDAQHDIESSAYDLGKILTEKFKLPNLKDKGKKRFLTRYTYDLTDKHQGFGQILDKKATLRKILETNISLGRVPEVGNIDATQFIISPSDKIYRVLSKEKDYESQAMIFFLRDYSGSMAGKSTELVVSQHVLIYSWLLYQYAKQVETRFILHDTEAKEVKDFYTYYNSKVAGGTQVFAAYRLVNQIVHSESLAQDYNIYVFHGTDGDDWDTDGREAIPELKKMLGYTNRVGITIAEHTTSGGKRSEVERYMRNSGLLREKPELLRMDIIQEDAEESRLIEGIKKLIGDSA